MSGSRMKLRAVLLSFVMVTSIMAAGVAFTGTAAAADDGSISVSSTTPITDGDNIADGATVSVTDSDLNGDSDSAESIIVQVKSGTESFEASVTGEAIAESGEPSIDLTTDQPVTDRNDDNKITKADITLNAQGDPGDDSIDSVSRNADGTVDLTVSGLENDEDETIDYTTGETLELTETGQDTGTFDLASSSDSLPISTSDAVGTLQVSDEEDITISYFDSDNSDRTGNNEGVLSSIVDTDSPDVASATAFTGDSASSNTAQNKIFIQNVDDDNDIIVPGSVTTNDFRVSTGQSVTGTSVSGDDITLTLGSQLSTGAQPDVFLKESASISDTAGNTQTGSSNGDKIGGAAATDNLKPKLTGVTATPGQTGVTLQFSEAVKDGDRDEGGTGLDGASFTYTDVNTGGAGGIASGNDFASAGSTSPTIALSSGVTSSDIGSDTIGIATPVNSDLVDSNNGNEIQTGTAQTLVQTGLQGTVQAAGAQFSIGGNNDAQAELVAGSANESIGEIKLRDQSSNPDAAFAGTTKLTFPAGVTINTSASTLNPTTVITSANDGVSIDGVSVSTDGSTITIDHSGTSVNGEEIRISSGSVVLSVNPDKFDTSSHPFTDDITLNTFSGKGPMSNALSIKSPSPADPSGGQSVSINQDNQPLPDTTDVRISSGELAKAIEGGSGTALIGNQTDIKLTLESGTGVTFASETSSSIGFGTQNLDGDTSDEVNPNTVSVSSSTVTIPVEHEITGSDTLSNLDIQGLKVDANGSATKTDLNVSITAPAPNTGEYTLESSSASPETFGDFVSITSPNLVNEEADKDNVVAGKDGQNLFTGGSEAIRLDADVAAQHIPTGSTVVISTNVSGVEFTQIDNNNNNIQASDLASSGSDSITSLSINQNGEVVIEIASEGGTGDYSADKEIIGGTNGEQDIGLTVPASLPDNKLIEFQATIDSTVQIADTDNRYQAQRPNTNLNNDKNVTVDLDADGNSGVEFSGQDPDGGTDAGNAIEIDVSEIAGQTAPETFVNITLEDNTGVTFDTRKDSATGINSDTNGDVDVSESSGTDDLKNVSITDDTIGIGLKDSGGLDTETVTIDEAFLNVSSNAQNTTLSVTTNTGDNKVTTSFDKQIIINSVDPSNVFADADTSQSDTNGDALNGETDFGTSSNDEAQIGEQSAEPQPEVESTVTSSVYVVDGGSDFGGADVNLEIVQSPNGSSGASLNTTQITTESDGKAGFEFTIGDTDGTYVVNASTDAGGVNITYVAQPGEVDAVTVTPIENGIAGASNTDLSEASLFVNATDANGNPVQAGPTVSVSADNVGADDVTAFDNLASDGTGTTNSDSLQDGEFTIDSSDGSSVVDVTSSQVEDVTITVSTGSSSDTGTVTLFDQVGGIDLSLNETSAAVDDTVSADATITDVDGTTIEVPDVNVNFNDNNNGNTTFDANADSESATTNANGVASVNVTAEQNGTSTIDASSNLRTASATLNITVEEDAPAYYTLKLSNSIADRDVHAAIISTFSTHRQSGSTALLPHSVYRYTRTHTGGQR